MGPARQASRQARLGLIALSVALLFGCTTSRDGLGARYRGHLHVLITSPSNEGLNKGLEEETSARSNCWCSSSANSTPTFG